MPTSTYCWAVHSIALWVWWQKISQINHRTSLSTTSIWENSSLSQHIHGPKVALIAVRTSSAKSPICHWDGFLDFNDPPYGQEKSDRLSIASTFQPLSFHYSPSIVSSFIITFHYTCLPLLYISLIPPSLDYAFLLATQSVFNLDTISVISAIYSYDITLYTLAYKPVVKKVHLVIAPINEEFCITWTLPDNLLSELLPLLLHPPDFIPGICFTQECTNNLDLGPAN